MHASKLFINSLIFVFIEFNTLNHNKRGRKFGREIKQRRALMCELAIAMIKHGKITTTEAKAKSLKIFLEKLITKAKFDGLASRRVLISKIGEGNAKKLIGEIAPRFGERHGGYTRIIKMPIRVSDGARMARIELVD